MYGWCPYKKGIIKDMECHFDGYCNECPEYMKTLANKFLEENVEESEEK